MKKILLPGLFALGIFANAQVDVSATSGTSTATYTTLKDAFDAVNAGTHQGDIQLTITANITETATAVLNAGLAYTSLNIKPATGVTPMITADIAGGAVLRILGNSATIDGSNTANGTTRDLTIQNTATTLPYVIQAGSSVADAPLDNVVIKNTNIISGTVASESYGISLGNGEGAITTGFFKDILIENNSVKNSYAAIHAAATVAIGNGKTTVKDNDLAASGEQAISQTGIYLQGTDGSIIENNQIFVSGSNNASKRGIWVGEGAINTTVHKNNITGVAFTGATNQSYQCSGILIASGSTGVSANANNIISENTISNVSTTGRSFANGISISGSNTSLTGGVIIKNNKISSIYNPNTGGYGAEGILINNTDGNNGGVLIFNNFISDVWAYGKNAFLFSSNGYGITVNKGTGIKIYNNTVYLATNQTVATGMTAAMYVGVDTTVAGSIDLRNNIFVNAQTTSTRYAIYSATPDNSIFSNIDYNNYYSAGTALGYIQLIRTGLSNIQSGFGGNMNSHSILPEFVSATDLHLTTSNTALDDLGTPLAEVSTDIDGEVRNTTAPDIGADEFTSVSLGTSNIVKEKISLYPNPFRDVLNISDVKEVKQITIMDITGRQIKTVKPESQINLSGLSAGVYMVSIHFADGRIQTVKTIKK